MRARVTSCIENARPLPAVVDTRASGCLEFSHFYLAERGEEGLQQPTFLTGPGGRRAEALEFMVCIVAGDPLDDLKLRRP
jgi:hypothetical protein